MSFRKFYDKYERLFLISLVVLLLATFSIGGALTNCEGDGRSAGQKFGGTYEPVPGEQAELDDADFNQRHDRFTKGQMALRMPTLEFRHLILDTLPPDPRHASWLHILSVDAAKEAGYAVGDKQLSAGIEELVGFRMRASALRQSGARYQEFLRNEYRGTQVDFESMISEIMLKDEFLAPLVYTALYNQTYEEAYEDWKRARERVDLEYVSLSTEPFADRAREAESARMQIGKQADLLKKTSATARTVRKLMTRALKTKEAKGEFPADLEALAANAPGIRDSKDAWDIGMRYKLTDGVLDLRSAGPDGEFDNADDVTDDVRKVIASHGSVQFVADAVTKWKAATEKWPASLKSLLERPTEKTVPPVPAEKQLKDGWDNDLVLQAGTGDAAPKLFSVGRDGEAGTDDDIHASFEAERAQVTLSGGMSEYILSDLRDAWDKPLRVGVSNPALWIWRVESAGPDGAFGTDDDLDEGNEPALQDFFAKNRGEFRLPTKRQFELIYAMLPLLSDAVLGQLWEAYPQHQPKTEEEVFSMWKRFRGTGLYEGETPGEGENVHGAEAMKKLAADRTANLIPGKDVFPALASADEPEKDDDSKDDDSKDDESEDGESEDGESEDDEPEDDAGADEDAPLPAAPDPDAELRKVFVDSGWRAIVIRDMLVERILNDVLTRARKSRIDAKVWDLEFGELEGASTEDASTEEPDGDEKDGDEKDGDEPDDTDKEDADKPAIPPRPEVIQLKDLYEQELSTYKVDDKPVFLFWRPEEPLTDAAWRKEPVLEDRQLRLDLNSISRNDAFGNVPTQMHGLAVKAVLHNVKFLPSRNPGLKEVRDEVYAAYLVSRQMDYAMVELRDLQKAAQRGADQLDDAAKQKRWDDTLAGAKAKYPSLLVENTGMIIGRRPPTPITVEEDDKSDGAEAARRRGFVWRRGYTTVEPNPSRQDDLVAEAGTFGRSILSDREGTKRAYLIRVREQSFPSKAEFSPRRYTEYMRDVVYGPRGMPPRQRRRLREREGKLNQTLATYMDDMEAMRAIFKLQTNTNLDLLQIP